MWRIHKNTINNRNKIGFKLLIITICMVFTFLDFSNGEQIQNHLGECCSLGKLRAGPDCKNNDYVMDYIPPVAPVWRGLCLSTFTMCCSKEFQNQQCLAGRYAAKNGGNCDSFDNNNNNNNENNHYKYDITSSYTDCCKACQIGLAVAASGHNCSSSQFSYFQKDESFSICCNDVYNQNNPKSNNEQQINRNSNDDDDELDDDDIDDTLIENDENSNINHNQNNNNNNNNNSKNFNINDEEETFVLSESEDICSKFKKKLCSHICENTKDSYVCKCHPGYKLDENLVTCSKIDNNDDIIDDNDDVIDDDDDDDDLENIDENSCPAGYARNKLTQDCEDIDECNLRLDTKCDPNQYCFNTIGDYKCLDIQSTTCQDGYRFNAKRAKCEDYDECEDNPCEDGYICINLSGSYECQREISSSRLPSFNEDKFLSMSGSGIGSGRKSIIGTCGPGYIYKHNKCIDIDECLTDKNTCDTHQICTNENGGYRCDCKIGFKMDSSLNACVDINECQINNHNCLATQRCDNTLGSYTCIRLQNCGTGYTLNAETGNCDDDNECELNTHDCPPGYECRNTIGSFRCDRKRYTTSRYIIYPKRTSPTTTTTTTRPSSSPFQNYTKSTLNSTERFVRPYYVQIRPPTIISNSSLTSTLPTPIITTPVTSTTASTTISTTPSKTTSTTSSTTPSTTTPTTPSTTPSTTTRSTTTEISSIYLRNQDQNNLESKFSLNRTINYHEKYTPPLSNPYYISSHRFHIQEPHQTTYATGNSCNSGFSRNYKGACVDIDECQIPGSCASHQRCINTNGSYRCQNLLQCSGGYKASIDGSSCVDIDECYTGEHNCGPDQICRNRIGGYICSCPIGHTLNNANRCVDVDECEHQVCPMNSNCVNTIGSYYCDCKAGFKKHREHEHSCIDVDECQDIPGLCEQKCINFWGSYRCACNPGFELDLYNNRSCNDIDECEVHKKYQLCTGICNNVPGSYECSCPPGYELNLDKTSCRDVDECQTMNVCQGRNEICTNIRGSYKCTYIQCPSGYTNDADQKNRCRIINNLCEGDDCYSKPSSYTYNFITLISNMMIPPQGRTFFILRGPSWYEKIDFDLKLIQVQAPYNIEKATMQHFSTTQMRHQIQLNLLRSLEGPQEIELELSMTVFMNDQPRGMSITKVFIIVSEYNF